MLIFAEYTEVFRCICRLWQDTYSLGLCLSSEDCCNCVMFYETYTSRVSLGYGVPLCRIREVLIRNCIYLVGHQSRTQLCFVLESNQFNLLGRVKQDRWRLGEAVCYDCFSIRTYTACNHVLKLHNTVYIDTITIHIPELSTPRLSTCAKQWGITTHGFLMKENSAWFNKDKQTLLNCVL